MFLHVHDKRAVLLQYLEEKQLLIHQAIFMGDDIPDYEVMTSGVLACAPADAASEILGISAYVSPRPGGFGCARDVIEKVLKSRGDWPLLTSIQSR